MNTINPAIALPTAPAGLSGARAASHGSSGDDLVEAARQFEGMVLTQLLRSARESGSGSWLGEGSDATASTTMEMAEAQLAQSMAHGGGLGLAAQISDQLAAARGSDKGD